MTLLDDMRSCDLVKTRELTLPDGGPTVYACNFTPDAFYSKAWTDLTVKARGLFLNADGSVFARGFDKFFTIGEPNGYATVGEFVDAARDGGASEAIVAQKINGFLAVVTGYVTNDGDYRLAVFSKSGMTDYAAEAREMIMDELVHVGLDLHRLAQYLHEQNVSMIFEICSPRDPHLVNEAPSATMIDIVDNTAQYSRNTGLFPYFADRYELPSAREMPYGIESGLDEAELDLLVEATGGGRFWGEGFVLRARRADGSWITTKVKTLYYRNAKILRTILKRVTLGRDDPLRPRNDRERKIVDALGQEVLADLAEVVTSGEVTQDGINGPVLDMVSLLDRFPAVALALEAE